MIHKAINGSHHHAAFFLDQMPQHLHPLPGDQVAVDIRIIKKKILGRIQPDCVCKAPEILVDLLRSGIIVSYH